MLLPRGSIRLGNAGTRPRPRNTRGEATVCLTTLSTVLAEEIPPPGQHFSMRFSASTSGPENHWYPLLYLFLPCFPDTLEPPHAWKILDARKHRTQAGCHVERDGRLTKGQGGSDSAGPPVTPPGGPRMAKQTADMPREAYFLVSRDPI